MDSGFFIVGAPRTGSTLLRRVLNAHDQVAIPPESPFLIDYLTADHVPDSRRLELLLDDPEYRAWGQGLRRDLQATDVAAGIAEIHAFYAAAVGKSRWGQKTPRLVRHWETLADAFPGARFIHIVRDPRAVAASLRTSAAHRSHALAAARRWRFDTNCGLTMERRLRSRALRVRYEDLVRKPDAIVRDVCAFLGLTFDPAMLQPAELRLNPHEAGRGHHDGVGRAITSASIETWRTSLSPRDLAAINAVVARLSPLVGYQADDGSPPGWWRRAAYFGDGLTMAVLKLVHDAGQRRPLWHVCRRRWQLGTFWSAAADYLSGR
jgi:hypothetical protein